MHLDVESRHVERLEEYLGGLLAIGDRIEWRFRQQDWVLAGLGLKEKK